MAADDELFEYPREVTSWAGEKRWQASDGRSYDDYDEAKEASYGSAPKSRFTPIEPPESFFGNGARILAKVVFYPLIFGIAVILFFVVTAAINDKISKTPPGEAIIIGAIIIAFAIYSVRPKT